MNAISNKELNIMRENVAKFAVWQNSNSLYAAEKLQSIFILTFLEMLHKPILLLHQLLKAENSGFYFPIQNIIGQEAGKTVIEEYLRRRGHSDVCSSTPDVPTSKLQAYLKPRSDEGSVSGTKKPFRTPKVVSVPSSQSVPKRHIASSYQENQVPSETSESRTIQKGNQVNSKKKKAGKVVSLAEAAKGSIVFQQGKPCSCQARRHRLVSNCLSCGKIVCEQEGEGPCSFCGALVLREGSTYAGLDESLPLQSDAGEAAEAYAKRLVEYDRNAAARTTVIDDQSDYYEIEGNSWLSMEVSSFSSTCIVETYGSTFSNTFLCTSNSLAINIFPTGKGTS